MSGIEGWLLPAQTLRLPQLPDPELSTWPRIAPASAAHAVLAFHPPQIQVTRVERICDADDR